MIELKSKSEFIRTLQGNEIVLVEFYKPGDKDCEIMHETMKEFIKYADQNILFCRINIMEYPEFEGIDKIPVIRLYYRSKLVFEQIGTLSTAELNLKVLRRSIREVFRSHNVGIRV